MPSGSGLEVVCCLVVLMVAGAKAEAFSFSKCNAVKRTASRRWIVMVGGGQSTFALVVDVLLDRLDGCQKKWLYLLL